MGQGWDGRFWVTAIPIFLQMIRKPLSIQDNQLVQHLIPVPVSLRPFLCYIPACQIQHLFQGCVAGEYAFCLGYFPELAVQSLYDIRRVHDPADVIWKLEEGTDIFPVVFPVADRVRIFSSPCFFYIFQF